MNWLNKLERKFGKYYIHNLMFYIVMITAFVYVLGIMSPDIGGMSNLVLLPGRVMQGEIWRLITFIFIPSNVGMMSIISMFFTLYLNYIAGSGLEQEWGGFKFNIYYLVSILVVIAVSFLTGAPATAAAINLSLFLAFARVYPDLEFLLFFLIPVKVKWLAYLDVAIIFYNIIKGPTVGYVLIALTPLISFLIFFGKDLFVKSKTRATSAVRKHEFNSKIAEVKSEKQEVKTCKVCGITEKDNPEMEFRYCSKCNGKFLYCSEHIRDHEHIE